MELTGARRTVQIMMFATVAWASYFVLVMWTWRGGTAFELYSEGPWMPHAQDFHAGNAFTVAVALLALVIVAEPLFKPTFERSRRACWFLCALIPLALFELGVWYFDSRYLLPGPVVYTSTGIATRTAMGLIGLSGLVLVPTIGFLYALERSVQRSR